MGDETSTVEVIVKVASRAKQFETAMHPHVRNCARTLGVSLEPLFPATSDTELLTYFVARVESAAATGIIEQLLRCDDVEGAYVKPKGVAPERNT